MFLDEARMKREVLLADLVQFEQRAQWSELQQLERLLASVRVVRARLGLRVLAGDR